MESRFYFLFLVPLLLASGCAWQQKADAVADDGYATPDVVRPDVDRRKIKVPRIDTENFEIGVYTGVLSVEDFGSNSVTGLMFDYHANENFFFEANYSKSTAGLTSFEKLSGSALLLTEDERDFSTYGLSLGYHLLPGEAFVFRNRALTTAFYVVAGAGSTSFAGDDFFTVNMGFGTRVLVTDWFALHIDVRDYLFDIDVLGEDKTTHNIELKIGTSIFF